jgi:hypothetical protein
LSIVASALRFRHLKSNGFDLEAINLKDNARRTFLMAVVVFSYVLSIHQGLNTYRKVPTRTFANQQTYKVESVFRYGINQLTQICIHLAALLQFLLDEIKQAYNQYRSADSIFVYENAREFFPHRLNSFEKLKENYRVYIHIFSNGL